jgi:hypothetical protein
VIYVTLRPEASLTFAEWPAFCGRGQLFASSERYEPGALVLAVAVCGAAAVLETSRVTHKHAQKTGRSRAPRTWRIAIFYQCSRLRHRVDGVEDDAP